MNHLGAGAGYTRCSRETEDSRLWARLCTAPMQSRRHYVPNRRGFESVARPRAVAGAGVQALRAGDGGEPPLIYHIMMIELLYHNRDVLSKLAMA